MNALFQIKYFLDPKVLQLLFRFPRGEIHESCLFCSKCFRFPFNMVN